MELNRVRAEQGERLRQLIADAFWYMEEKRRKYWTERMYRYYAKRLRNQTKMGWISFLGNMTDKQACGEYVDPKLQRYCILIRNEARERKDDIYANI